MAVKVYHRKLVDRSTFRKLPFRARFWDVDNAYALPFIKRSRLGPLWNLGTDHVHNQTLSSITVETIRIPRVWRTT